MAVDGGPQLHELAPKVVDVVGDLPNVLMTFGQPADAPPATSAATDRAGRCWGNLGGSTRAVVIAM
jgi:hypothetical protein